MWDTNSVRGHKKFVKVLAKQSVMAQSRRKVPHCEHSIYYSGICG